MRRDTNNGALQGSERAIPTLANLIRDPDADGDTRTSGIDALGQIARKRFRRQSEPADAAIRWLDEHGH
jgi:HEAT repeat protein